MWTTTPLIISLPLLTITIPGLYITYIAYSMHRVVINDEITNSGSTKPSEPTKAPTSAKQEILINADDNAGKKDVSTTGDNSEVKDAAVVDDNSATKDDSSNTQDVSKKDETQKNPVEDDNKILTKQEQEMLTIKSKMKIYTRDKIDQTKKAGNAQLSTMWTKVMSKVDTMSYEKLKKLQTFFDLST